MPLTLASAEGSLELAVIDYEYPDLEVPAGAHLDWAEDWLIIRGSVRVGELAWVFAAPCLTTGEAAELSDWLRSAAAACGAGTRAGLPSALRFTEPNLVFEIERVDGDEAVVAVAFYLEAAPDPERALPNDDDDGLRLTLAVSADGLRRAAQDWAAECAAFPAR